MKQATLKTFVQKKFNRYLNDNYPNEKRTVNNFLELSKKDHRVLVAAASYYASKGMFHLASKFNPKYVNEEVFMNSFDKYVMEFQEHKEVMEDGKMFYYNELKKMVDSRKVSMYAIAKACNTSPINVSRFIKDKNLSCLSVSKAHIAYKKLRKSA